MGIITISAANCKNCYRCVRFCPVKAISIRDDQARIEDKACIQCGICVNQCPQNAKQIQGGLEAVLRYRASGQPLLLSLAPSYSGAFEQSLTEIAAELLKRGFSLVEETAVGARIVAGEYRRLVAAQGDGGCLISSPCSVIINLVEKHYPRLLPHLTPVVSPMIAHGRLLKARWGPESRVIFAGPCIAKKEEAREPAVAGAIDAVLTFAELREFLASPELPPAQRPRSLAPNPDAGKGRWFPLPGGLLRAAGLAEGVLDQDILIVDGMEEVMAALEALAAGEIKPRLVEMLACKGGCIGGPFMPKAPVFPARRDRFITTLLSLEDGEHIAGREEIELGREFRVRPYQRIYPGEKKIRAILDAMGKTTPDKELNCGSCGYESCRDKAVAIAQGMAELEMCVPYMREKAENLASTIIDFTPNAILVVDAQLRIKEFNPAAEKLFKVMAEAVKERPLGMVMDETHFATVLNSRRPLQVKVEYPHLGIVTHQRLSYIEEEDLVLALIIDITDMERQKEAFATVKRETIAKAQEVIEKQMKVAQLIAGQLGETTAESKVLLTKLIQLVQEGGDENVLP
ncbi:MAG: [Fe-Fe] hydrogenase large subunit C-terminal domain-containing protein [bacterium]